MLADMLSCAYCGQPATMRIPSNPEEVCQEHAVEYRTELLAFTKSQSQPCVTHEPACDCQSCKELTASYLRAVAAAVATEEESADCRRALAVAAAGPSPLPEEQEFQIRLAS